MATLGDMAHSPFDSVDTEALAPVEDVPCAGDDGDQWFTSHPSAVERAKSLCRTCPLRESCLAEAVDRREPWGVWGGELFENGAIVTFKRPRGRPRKDAVLAS